MNRRQRCLLIVMPWHALGYPSLAVGLLQAVGERVEGWEIDAWYANVDWADYLLAETNGRFDPKEYARVSEDWIFSGAGEWVFASALREITQEDMREFAYTFPHPEHLPLLHELQSLAPKFVKDIAAKVVKENYDLVGLTTTFAQNVASLSLAKEIKQIESKTKIVLGGGNCDGPMGAGLHRAYRFLDYVVSGDGEDAFHKLLEHLSGKRTIQEVPNLVWRDSIGESQSTFRVQTQEFGQLAPPSFDSYFTRLRQSQVQRYIEPHIVIEGSRGCWWGEKHHCTFCGLNGSGMAYRRKDGERFLAELEYLASRHQVLDVITSDNIIDVKYFDTVLPALREKSWDIRLHFETKSNLSQQQIDLLAESGVRHLQPGIESLSSKVLKLMNKGVTGARNVQALRDCEQANITVTWSHLYGFPGEQEEDYQKVLDQIRKLVHLAPPLGASRIVLERFSPFFMYPWMGFEDRRPAAYYAPIYGVSQAELAEMVYMFDTDPAGISESMATTLAVEIRAWRQAYERGASFVAIDNGESIRVVDTRTPAGESEWVIDDAVGVAIHRLTRSVTSRAAVMTALKQSFPDLPNQAFLSRLEQLDDAGYFFTDERRIVGLPLSTAKFRKRNFLAETEVAAEVES